MTKVTSSSLDGIYRKGQKIVINIKFSEEVKLITPEVMRLTLETGATDSQAVYGGATADSIDFVYTVAAGDASTDLGYGGTTSLKLLGASIRSLGGVDVDLTLPSPGKEGSLSAASAIVVTGLPPTAPSSLSWMQSSPHTGTAVTANWSLSTANGLIAQSVQLFDDSNCLSSVSSVFSLAVTDTSYTFRVGASDSYYFGIAVADNYGEASPIACSGGIDVVLPPPGITFTGAPTGMAGDTTLNITVSSPDAHFAHYSYKVIQGSASCTGGGYSGWQTSAVNITDDISGLPNGPVKVCALSGDSDGNSLPESNAYTTTWIKDGAVMGLVATGTEQGMRLSWDAAPGGPTGYLVVRRSGAAVTWSPTDGTSYPLGIIDSDHFSVGNATSTLGIHDLGLTNSTTYHYKVFSYGAGYVYDVGRDVSATPQAGVTACSTYAPLTTSALCADPTSKGSGYAAGAGSEADPYVICTGTQMDNVRNNLASYFVIGDNISLAGHSPWTPISSFTGTIDGNQFLISDLTVSGAANQRGLFGITNGATISKIVLKSGSIAGTDKVGALIGESTNTDVAGVVNCLNVTAGDDVGGVVGDASGTGIFREIFNEGIVNAGTDTGGIIGVASNDSKLIWNSGQVTGVSNVAGGIGYMNGSMEAASNSGVIHGTSSEVGGIVGDLRSSLSWGWNYGSVSGDSSRVGGIVGHCDDCNMTKLYNHGSVSGQDNTGGIIGLFAGVSTLSTSRNYGSVTGEQYTGGIGG